MSTNQPSGSKNFYGEYSLEQWIELILREEIVLPRYQRAFVWTEEDVKDLIDSLKEGLFVPPITIGNYDGKTNYILDGQQRLSAILIAYLGLFPKKENFQFSNAEYDSTANENDDPDEGEEAKPIEWQFSYFTREGRDKQSILEKIDSNKYKKVDYQLDTNFWKESYIGFSLIIPNSNEVDDQQTLYSSVFRNINIKGKSLSHIESRKSLYFLKPNFDLWFSPRSTNKLTINKAPIDFVRYLSLLSQYAKEESAGRLAQNYKTKMEQYYELYILAEINSKEDNLFSPILGKQEKEKRYETLRNKLEAAVFPKAFTSIIDADTYLFGLIYHTIVTGQDISITKRLTSEIDAKTQKYKGDPKHRKSPSNLAHLRKRVQDSIAIYNNHLIAPNKSSNEA